MDWCTFCSIVILLSPGQIGFEFKEIIWHRNENKPLLKELIQHRVYSAISDIQRERKYAGKNLLLVTHGESMLNICFILSITLVKIYSALFVLLVFLRIYVSKCVCILVWKYIYIYIYIYIYMRMCVMYILCIYYVYIMYIMHIYGMA